MLYFLVILLVVFYEIALELVRELMKEKGYFVKACITILSFIGYFYLIHFIGSVWKVMLIFVGVVVLSAILSSVLFKNKDGSATAK